MAKLQDGGGRDLGFAERLITSERIDLFCLNFNSTYLDIIETEVFHQKCKKKSKIQDGKNPRWRRPRSWICRKVNNF